MHLIKLIDINNGRNNMDVFTSNDVVIYIQILVFLLLFSVNLISSHRMKMYLVRELVGPFLHII